MAPRDEDIGWNFGEAIDGNKRKIKCKFCNKIINGGITRLKQHLAHKKGDVAPCEYVSAEVKREMMSLLMNYKDKKKDKQRMEREYEEELIKSMNRPIDDDDDDGDKEMQWVMRQSRTQHEFDYYRGVHSRSDYYDDGGGSFNPQMNKSASVREVGYVRGRNLPFQPTSTPAARLRAREVELEKDCQKKKQSKLPTSLFKKAKKAVLKAWGNFVIDTNMPFKGIESSFTNPLMDTIREYPQVRAPSAYEISEVYLRNECKEMEGYIKSLKPIWNERGVTIMCDGWSGPTNMQIINFLVYSVRGTVFHKSIDATDVLCKDADYYFKIMKKVVEEIGEDKVVQVVTDNESAVKAGGKKLMEEFPHLYWTACAAHCLDLLLEDIGKKSSVQP